MSQHYYDPRLPARTHHDPVVTAGSVLLLASLFVWPLALVAFVCGVVAVAQRHVGAGVTIMVLSVALGWIGLFVALATV